MTETSVVACSRDTETSEAAAGSVLQRVALEGHHDGIALGHGHLQLPESLLRRMRHLRQAMLDFICSLSSDANATARL